MAKNESVKIGRVTVELTNLDKIFYPKPKFTKGDVISYYRDIAPVILPHLKDRPITMKRFPNGITGDFFYEKQAPRHTPDWIKTFAVKRTSSRSNRSNIDYLLLNDTAALLWSVNTANIEMHAFLARAPKINQPTQIVFDLDPGPPAGVIECAEVAFELKKLFDGLGLESFVKVSGSKGLQLYIPLNTPATYEVTSPFAKTVAELMEERLPNLVVSKMAKALRKGKVFIDWSQNDDTKTTVIVYSLRAKSDQPFVSTPVEWPELARALKQRNRDALYFLPKAVLKRVEKKGDLFAPLLKLKQKLPKDFVDAIGSKPGKSGGRRRGTDMEAYKAKRNFKRTSEPLPRMKGRGKKGKNGEGGYSFVIQKHAASHLHYDFRLEMDGVLRSWAVPKGPSTKKGERRLAVHVEDHPLDYAGFEGTIPKGNYGGGTVMVWDRGTYEVASGNPAADYRKGKLHFTLHGEKLNGEWALVSTRDEKNWFLIKVGSDGKKISKKRDDESVVSGRTMAKIASDRKSAEWVSNR